MRKGNVLCVQVPNASRSYTQRQREVDSYSCEAGELHALTRRGPKRLTCFSQRPVTQLQRA